MDAPDDMAEIVGEFLIESLENLDQLDHDLVALEQDPTSTSLLGNVFRTIHTIKGTSGFLGYAALGRLTHAGEDLLSRLRDGELALTDERTTGLLELVDAVRSVLAEVARSGGEGLTDHGRLLARLAALTGDEPTDAVGNAAPRPLPPADDLLGQVLVAAGSAGPDDITLAVLEQRMGGDDRPIGQILVDHGTVEAPDLELALQTQAGGRRAAAESIRVDVELLDSLMRLSGDLVLARNQVMQHALHLDDPELVRTSQRLNTIATELQQGVLQTRMQPIDAVWSKLTRVVRDLGVACGKSVRLELEGGDTELDRTVLEAVRDPLTHLIRNAVDHGVERPSARVAAGKPETGVLRLRASHSGGQVTIEISDDGAGVDLDRVRDKAVELGLTTSADAAAMSEPDVLALIFLPGFSTAQAVSSVSGRGVGMDVVQNSIVSIGGTVDVSSTPGRGSSVRIRVPLTLAILPALAVRCAGEVYAIAQAGVLELLRLEGEHRLDDLLGMPVLRYRGALLPLVDLAGVLGLPPADHGDADVVMVLTTETGRYGLRVHEVLNTVDVVVKPLSRALAALPVYAGATVRAAGAVALILDADGIARHSGVGTALAGAATTGGQEHASGSDGPGSPAAASVAGRGTRQLVVSLSDGRRCALPMEGVVRLEEFAPGLLERLGNRSVVQYSGGLLPLVDLVTSLSGSAPELDAATSVVLAPALYDADRPLQVVVYRADGRPVGLVVQDVLDIVEAVVTPGGSDPRGSDPGGSDPGSDRRAGASVLVEGQVVELLDVAPLVSGADPQFYEARGQLELDFADDAVGAPA